MAYSVCRHIARSAAKNFYYGFAVLPRRKRNALSAVYAFMRRCDDIADDDTLSLEDRQNRLADWLDKVHRALAAQPTDDPVLLALADAQRVTRFRLASRPARLRHRCRSRLQPGRDSSANTPLPVCALPDF
jgi:phytoene/squalene synthetase